MVRRGLGITALAASLLGLAGCGLSRNTLTDDTTIDSRIASVRVSNDSGNVTIKTGDRTTVRRTVHYDNDKPGVTHRVEGDVLIIEPCTVRNCSIDYDLTVPTGVKVAGAVESGSTEVEGVASVNLKASSGRVTVRRVAGQVNVDSDSGSVHVSDVGDAVTVLADSGRVVVDNARAAVTVQADSGTVEARGIGGAADLRSDSGSVKASLTSPQSVRAQADSGSITLTVPRAAYRVNAETDSGNVRGDVRDDAAGTHQLNLHTDSGNITISYA